MTNDKQVICRHCGKLIDKETAYSDAKRKTYYFCDVYCAIEYDKERQKKSKPPKATKVKEEPIKVENKKSDRESLFDYIVELYGYFPSYIPYKVKNMIDDGFTYKGVELALKYWVETLEHGWNEKSGIGIVPYIYEDAKNFWIKQQNIKVKVGKYKEDNIIKASSTSKNLSLLKYKMRKK